MGIVKKKKSRARILRSLQKGITPYIRAALKLEDPKKHLFIPTPLGLASIVDKINIEEFVRKAVPDSEILDVKIEELGGVLNPVYLLTYQKNDKKQQVVMKKFKDWSSFKWLPLALWTIGIQSFAVMGQTRLEREYTINQFLHSQGVSVPRVLYVSLRERLIFEEYIEGEKMVEIVKRVIKANRESISEAS